MALLEKKVTVGELRPGMYISKLDRPWCETPFPIQGFHIKDENQIHEIRKFCKFVTVDFELSRVGDSSLESPVAKPAKKQSQLQLTDMDTGLALGESKSTVARVQPQKSRTSVDTTQIYLKPVKVARGVYGESLPLKKELKKAHKVRQELYRAIDHISLDVANGGQLDPEPVKNAAKQVVECVIRNPDALVWISRLQQSDNHLYNQSLNSTVWAAVFGRHLGLKPVVLENLVTGVLLAKVGMTRVDPFLLKKPQLSDYDLKELEGYVNQSVEILNTVKGFSPKVLSIVATHQERIDGTGYPNQLVGEEIPILGRIAGLVIEYEEMVNPRWGQEPQTCVEATATLHKQKGQVFQVDLVEEFIKAIGVYPTGTVVELSTAEVAIVSEHNDNRRLRPKVMVVLDHDKRPYPSQKMLDLNSQKELDSSLEIKILRGLPKGAHDIDPALFVKALMPAWYKVQTWLS